MTSQRQISFSQSRLFLLAMALYFCLSCSQRTASGPDQTAVGATTGAGLGASAGMVIGNQISHIGPGAAVGAGFGLIAGALTGAGQDRLEQGQLESNSELRSLAAQVAFNRQQLIDIQSDYDESALSEAPSQPYLVFFDDNATNLRAGAIADLENIAENIKKSRAATRIEVAGNSDETGSAEYNMQLSEARARNTASYLQARGISIDSVEIKAYGSSRPIATNATAEGRQLNRRVEIRVLK